MAGKYFWIKERENPQLGTYYVKCGRLTVAEARRMENSLYGSNIMHRFNTESDYNKEISELILTGERLTTNIN